MWKQIFSKITNKPKYSLSLDFRNVIGNLASFSAELPRLSICISRTSKIKFWWGYFRRFMARFYFVCLFFLQLFQFISSLEECYVWMVWKYCDTTRFPYSLLIIDAICQPRCHVAICNDRTMLVGSQETLLLKWRRNWSRYILAGVV